MSPVPRGVARRVLREEGRRKAALLLDYYLAEAAGLEVWLVNARDVKHLPGGARATGPIACGCAS